MAASCQLLFISMFIGGLIVRLYQDIASDSLGSPALAHRFIGLSSVDEAVVMMIIVAFAMVGLLFASLGADAYWHAVEEHRQRRWSTCTMEPPFLVKPWPLKGIYACFLSHYKMESASEARYMHEYAPCALNPDRLKRSIRTVNPEMCFPDLYGSTLRKMLRGAPVYLGVCCRESTR
eukprot:2605152-Prymnesium_polylepis.2